MLNIADKKILCVENYLNYHLYARISIEEFLLTNRINVCVKKLFDIIKILVTNLVRNFSDD